MAVGGLFEYAKRALFAQPTPERALMRAVKPIVARRVVELGIESFDTTLKLVEKLAKQAGNEPIGYTAFDAFDERPAAAEPLSLIDAHRRLAGIGARVRLRPGGATARLADEANELADTDLVLISAAVEGAALDLAWHYLPRMCHPRTLVLQREDTATADSGAEFWRTVPLGELTRLATGGLQRAA